MQLKILVCVILKVFGRLGYQILMDFLKIWHDGRRHKVLWYIFRFFKFLKILDFINVFLKISVFRNFGGQNLQILKFRDSHFVECVILHLCCFLCGLLPNSIFDEFRNIEPTLVKIGVKWPHKNVNFSKIFPPISTKFGHSMSNQCKVRYSKFCVDIYNGFGVILEKPRGGRFCPPPPARRGLRS